MTRWNSVLATYFALRDRVDAGAARLLKKERLKSNTATQVFYLQSEAAIDDAIRGCEMVEQQDLLSLHLAFAD